MAENPEARGVPKLGSSELAFETFQSTRYFRALDGLRCLSIVPVVWHHACLTPLPGVLGKGPAGVQLFFVISGFLVTTLLLRERERAGAISLGRFYTRRALRIFPLYYLVLGAVTVHSWFASPSLQRSHFFESLIYYATYTSNWWVAWKVPHAITFAFAWTLAIEEQFYLMWPPVLRFFSGWLPAAAFMLTLLILSQIVTDKHLSWLFPEGSFWKTFCWGLSSSIALGSLLAVALHYRQSFRWFEVLLGWRMAAVATFALVVYLLFTNVHHLWFHVALTLWLGSTVVASRHGMTWLLDQPALVHVGRLSYALYLTHFVAVGGARLLVDPQQPLLVFAVSLPLALVLAEVAHRVVENPFLRRKARYARI